MAKMAKNVEQIPSGHLRWCEMSVLINEQTEYHRCSNTAKFQVKVVGSENRHHFFCKKHAEDLGLVQLPVEVEA